MTRKDYILIAEAINQARATANAALPARQRACMLQGINLTTNELADRLYADNPRFDRGRFYAACNDQVPA